LDRPSSRARSRPGARPCASLLSLAFVARSLTEPLQNQIGDLQAVLVLHHHVTVAPNPARHWIQHLRLAIDRFQTGDERLTSFEALLPGGVGWQTGRIVSVIAEHDEQRHCSELLDLIVRVAV